MLTPELTPSHSVASSPSLPPTPDPRPLDLVIANYNESLTWLSTYSHLATVYSKGKLPPDLSIFREVMTLPNWGRESHTYLHHIVHNYDNLADVTLFLQGNIHDMNDGTPAHTDLDLDEIVGMAKQLADMPDILGSRGVNAQYQPQGGVLPLGKINSFVDWDGVRYLPGWIERRGKGLRRSQYSPEQFWNYICNGTADNKDPRWTAVPAEIKWTQGALFAVTRQTIQRRPRAVYERAYNYFHSLADINPEEGHYMERFWLALFGYHGVEQRGLCVPEPVKSWTEEGENPTAEGHGAGAEDEGIFRL
ncbi:uncharacterized protein Z519_03964 [Cladophialophora bantiana CBS 173.52]|uniref:Uncharacterized protein n=1 Tax=Cladophialophora bantiana (strain ATCC 10958 / CBS 173.52 / CDC B-1940 / NIH 8579) TaxID=1442370 RepID=A0A0D2HWR9_CLAB1|nr:uncharacterized protein Z519_03964 [Cladophialophora bantiana CBS 173.52]KIW95380.1 hypothetical protein Z519_03964 [Cladophialophora bantiana CBS 173.52]